MTDDDLRFGDVSGANRTDNKLVNWMIQAFQVLVLGYVLLKTIEILLDISIPLI
ncbi:hypothetical protein SAMN05216559_2368 [Halomicrobium zhouii]|uniref:Uncharacterized protein n=1 Tax=Halomicrobium zhouii TaxID=767519 RepID=A0A1I6LAQ7_9EURY|nr:hypothetical protein SAMN05216559_2368 [Halomicrobium zhouii]